MEHTKLTPIESLSHYFTKNRKKISLPNLFFSNTIVFEQLQDPPETPNTEETSVSVAYNSMENTNSKFSKKSEKLLFSTFQPKAKNLSTHLQF